MLAGYQRIARRASSLTHEDIWDGDLAGISTCASSGAARTFNEPSPHIYVCRARLGTGDGIVSPYPSWMPTAELNSKSGTFIHEITHLDEGALPVGHTCDSFIVDPDTGEVTCGSGNALGGATAVRTTAKIAGADLTRYGEPFEFFANDLLNTAFGLPAYP